MIIPHNVFSMLVIIAYSPDEHSNWVNERDIGCNNTFDGSQDGGKKPHEFSWRQVYLF